MQSWSSGDDQLKETGSTYTKNSSLSWPWWWWCRPRALLWWRAAECLIRSEKKCWKWFLCGRTSVWVCAASENCWSSNSHLWVCRTSDFCYVFLFVTKKETFRLPVRPEITKLLFFCVFIDVIRKTLKSNWNTDLVSVFRGSSEISALAWISEAESRNSFVHTVWI